METNQRGGGICPTTTLPADEVSTVELAANMIPTFSGDTKKAVYLSYRVSNFSIRQSTQLASVSEKQVRRWRDDPVFAHMDGDGLTELRKKMAAEYMDMQFTRNFRLIMEKDFRVLYQDACGAQLSPANEKYLEKIRQHYTPQALAMVKQILGGGTTDAPFDFTKLTMEIKREQITFTQESSNG